VQDCKRSVLEVEEAVEVVFGALGGVLDSAGPMGVA